MRIVLATFWSDSLQVGLTPQARVMWITSQMFAQLWAGSKLRHPGRCWEIAGVSLHAMITAHAGRCSIPLDFASGVSLWSAPQRLCTTSVRQSWCAQVCVCVLIDEIRGCKVGCIASFRRTASHAEGVQRSRRPWRTLMEQWKRLSRDGSCSREDRTDASCNGGGSTSMGLCCWLDA